MRSTAAEIICEIHAGPAASDEWGEAARAAQDFDEEELEDRVDAGWAYIAECHDDW